MVENRYPEDRSGDPVDTLTPKAVTLVEVGPRDGLQFEKMVVPTDRKLALITRLIAAGLNRIQVASFVHPGKVPQMADAEQLIGCLPRIQGVEYSALVLNQRGLDRALASGIEAVEISISASDSHSRRNSGMTHEAALEQGLDMIGRAISAGLTVRASVQCAFGCVHEGDIPTGRVAAIVGRFIDGGAQAISLADTTGMASPPLVKAVLKALPRFDRLPLALHLHDTRGLGLVNLMAAMSRGVTVFDTALAGMGGCPFVPGAAGNIATEDTAHLLATLGIRTGVNVARVAAISLDMEAFFKKRFPGRMHRLTAPLTRPATTSTGP
jgi:hydroxymethylglutaryl-CoA lyase